MSRTESVDYPIAILTKLWLGRLPVSLRPLIREKIKRSIRKPHGGFLAFCEFVLGHVGQIPAAHHRLLIAELEAVARGENDRLMVFMPPGSAKSTYGTVLFPVWQMLINGKNENKPSGIEIIGCSHTADLAEGFSKKIQKVITEHGEFLGFSLATEAASEWETNNGCNFKSAGVNGPITGRRADVGIIDDPVKSRKDAESETYRRSTYNWYTADFLTRLKPGAPIVLIQTRWHEEDLAGKILANEDGWRVLSLPAIAGLPGPNGDWVESDVPDPLGRRPGQFLWGDDTYGYAADIRRKMDSAQPRDYWSLYMQSPRALTGGVFRTDRITILDAIPAGRMQWIRAWDLGGTKAQPGRDPDATAGVLMAKDQENRIYIDTIVKTKDGPDEIEKLIIATASQDSRLVPISLPQDPGQAGKAQVLWLTRKLAGYKVHSSTESGDKGTRASPFAAQVNVGNVYLIRGEWNKDFIEELQTFPSGKHDDMVDAASRAFNHLLGAVATDRFKALAS